MRFQTLEVNQPRTSNKQQEQGRSNSGMTSRKAIVQKFVQKVYQEKFCIVRAFYCAPYLLNALIPKETQTFLNISCYCLWTTDDKCCCIIDHCQCLPSNQTAIEPFGADKKTISLEEQRFQYGSFYLFVSLNNCYSNHFYFNTTTFVCLTNQ